jgi:hypothetical protein
MAIKFNNNLKNYYFFDTNPTIRLSFNEFETKFYQILSLFEIKSIILLK